MNVLYSIGAILPSRGLNYLHVQNYDYGIIE